MVDGVYAAVGESSPTSRPPSRRRRFPSLDTENTLSLILINHNNSIKSILYSLLICNNNLLFLYDSHFGAEYWSTDRSSTYIDDDTFLCLKAWTPLGTTLRHGKTWSVLFTMASRDTRWSRHIYFPSLYVLLSPSPITYHTVWVWSFDVKDVKYRKREYLFHNHKSYFKITS